MKGIKYVLGISLAMAGLFTSCDVDNVTEVYEPTTVSAVFATESQSVSFPAHGYEGFDVEVMRGGNIGEAATVNLSAVLIEGGQEVALPAEFQVPSSVSFAAGEGITTFHVSVGDIRSGKNFELAISLDANAVGLGGTDTKYITVYRDYTYSAIGDGLLVSSFFEAQGSFTWEKADDITWYKAIAPYENGYDIVFKVAADGKTVTVARQAFASKVGNYGTGYVAGSGTLENGVIKVALEFTVSAGSFGTYVEQFVLPAANE